MKNTSELIVRIIKLLDENFLVYIHRATSKVVAIPEFDDYMSIMESVDDNYELLYLDIESNPDDYFQIHKLTSREVYNIMMDFSLEQERSDSLILVKALRLHDPIKEFTTTIKQMDNLNYNNWKTFYSEQLTRSIRNRLCKQHLHIKNCS